MSILEPIIAGDAAVYKVSCTEHEDLLPRKLDISSHATSATMDGLIFL